MTGEDRECIELLLAAWNACEEINSENPIAAAEAMPEIWRLLVDAFPIIEEEAERRQNWGERHNREEHQYATEMRDLADRIEALALKATAKD